MTENNTRQHALFETTALHLIPGILVAVFFVVAWTGKHFRTCRLPCVS